MKFTNGFWRIREEIEPIYATEYYDREMNGKELTVYAATKHMGDRGDTLNQPLLTITFSSPMENVIKVCAVHFKGALYQGPHYGAASSGCGRICVWFG